MTLGLIFNHFFDKTHFGAFSVFYTNYSLIFGDKKIQTQKWCIREKFWRQKLGVTKGFYLLIFFYFWFRPLFGKMIAAPPVWKTSIDKFLLWDLSVMFPSIKNMFKVPGGFRWQFFHVQISSAIHKYYSY